MSVISVSSYFTMYLSIRLLPQRVQHASAYPGSSVSHNKFHLLCSLLVCSRTNKSTKDNLKFHSQHSSTGSPTICYSLLQACPTLTQERTQLCRLSGSLTGWISGLSVSWVAETRSERDRRNITVKLSNKTKQFIFYTNWLVLFHDDPKQTLRPPNNFSIVWTNKKKISPLYLYGFISIHDSVEY